MPWSHSALLGQINRSMKVPGGLVGTTLNPAARTKFFLISPELARLSEEAILLAGISSSIHIHHHGLSSSVLTRQEKNIKDLTSTIQGFTNPFAENVKDLCNIVTKAVMPDVVRKDVVTEPEIGKNLAETFVAERLTSGNVNLWSPMKKRQLKTWRSASKKMKMKAGDTIVELQEGRSLFARMLVISKSRSEINLRETIATYEFSVVPRAMFAADRTMLHCSTKSNLMAILEKLPTNNQETLVPLQDAQVEVAGDAATSKRKLVTIIDGMAEVQCFRKPDWVQNCSQLANCFTQQLLEKYHDSDEMHVVFDRYDITDSLKTFTRQKRQGGQAPVAYHVTDTTNITNVEMKRLLSHTRTSLS